MNVRFSKKWFNPLYFILNDLLQKDSVRTILIYGGKSSAKTFSICQLMAKESVIKGHSVLSFRKFSTDIPTTIKETYSKAIDLCYLKPAFEKQDRRFLSTLNESKIILRGLDSEEKAKGTEGFMYVHLEELNQFEYEEYEQFDMSLRGMKGQKLFATWNPVSENSWVKKNLVDTYNFIETEYKLPCPTSFVKISDCGKVVLIKTTYEDNYWVVGGPGYGYRDENLISVYNRMMARNYNAYRVNVLGEWGVMRTGGEYWKQFDETKHVRQLEIEDTTIHVSIDNNVNPYITQTIWQIHPKEKQINQVAELLCRSPENNAPKAARAMVKWLDKIGYEDVLFLYGDPSASARSTVDENSASFYDKYIDELRSAGVKVVSKVQKSAPAVALRGAFINEIYESNYAGWSIAISDKCQESIQDYILVKEDADGSMKKIKEKNKETGVTFEPQGHCSDAKAYFITTVLKAYFDQYKQRNNKVKGYSVPG